MSSNLWNFFVFYFTFLGPPSRNDGNEVCDTVLSATCNGAIYILSTTTGQNMTFLTDLQAGRLLGIQNAKSP